MPYSEKQLFYKYLKQYEKIFDIFPYDEYFAGEDPTLLFWKKILSLAAQHNLSGDDTVLSTTPDNIYTALRVVIPDVWKQLSSLTTQDHLLVDDDLSSAKTEYFYTTLCLVIAIGLSIPIMARDPGFYSAIVTCIMAYCNYYLAYRFFDRQPSELSVSLHDAFCKFMRKTDEEYFDTLHDTTESNANKNVLRQQAMIDFVNNAIDNGYTVATNRSRKKVFVQTNKEELRALTLLAHLGPEYGILYGIFLKTNNVKLQEIFVQQDIAPGVVKQIMQCIIRINKALVFEPPPFPIYDIADEELKTIRSNIANLTTCNINNYVAKIYQQFPENICLSKEIVGEILLFSGHLYKFQCAAETVNTIFDATSAVKATP